GPTARRSPSARASEPVASEERPHPVQETGRVVSHDRVPGAPHLHDAAAWNGAHEALRAPGGEDVALAAAHQQRWAAQPADGPPQCLDVAPCGAADRWIEFPGPTAVRPLSHGVAEPLADVRERSSRIERVGVPNRLVEAREVVYPQLPPDGFTAGGSDR